MVDWMIHCHVQRKKEQESLINKDRILLEELMFSSESVIDFNIILKTFWAFFKLCWTWIKKKPGLGRIALKRLGKKQKEEETCFLTV